MLPISLLEETIVRDDGVGPSIDVSRAHGKLLVLTLGITRTIEQESLQVAVWGSPDGIAWGLAPLLELPLKSYCGLYSTLLNLAAAPHIRYLRVHWKCSRWSKPGNVPLFGFHVDVEESGNRMQTAVA